MVALSKFIPVYMTTKQHLTEPFRLPPAERPCEQPPASIPADFNFNCGENPPLDYLIEVLEMSKVLFQVPSVGESESK